MSDQLLRGLAWAWAAVMLAGSAAAVVFSVNAGVGLRSSVIAVLATAVWGGVGATLAIVRPRNAVGWLLLGIGIALTLSLVTGSYVEWSKHRGAELPGVAWAAWSGSLGWIVTIGFLIPRLILVFPDGRIPTRRWRIVALAQYAVVAGITVGAFKPGPLTDIDYKRYENPVGIGALGWLDSLPSWLGPAAAVVLVVATFGAAASLIARFRASRGIERQQLKLLAWAVALTALTWILAMLLPAGLLHDGVETISLLGLTIAPLTILVAVLRYRLYDVDTVISKTLVYGSLTVTLGAAYVGLVLLGQAVFSSFAGGSNLAIAVSTLVVAALFLPLRGRIQRVVDRRFYRRRYDAQRTLEAFGSRLREETELVALTAELRGVVVDTMQPAHASLWLREPA